MPMLDSVIASVQSATPSPVLSRISLTSRYVPRSIGAESNPHCGIIIAFLVTAVLLHFLIISNTHGNSPVLST